MALVYNNMLSSTFLAEILRDNPSKAEIQNVLISLLENCEILNTRIASLKAIERYRIKNEEIYKILENILISDENSLIRSEAVSLIIKNFIKFGVNALNFIIENEKSLLVIKRLWNGLKFSNSKIANMLYDKVIIKYVNTYLLVPKEVVFLIDLECMKETQEFGFFKPMIKNHHILRLDLAGWNLDHLPDSIGDLVCLTHLNLWNNKLRNLPKSFENLSNLEELYLDWNNFTKIPEIDWLYLKSLKKLSLANNSHLIPNNHSLQELLKQNFSIKYEKEGVDKNEIPALISLEVLTGQKVEKVDDNQKLNNLYAFNYRIDKSGHIIGIYIYGYYDVQIKRIPNEIFSLKFLKELVIRHQQIEEIPKCVNNLLSLEKLDLMGNKLERLPSTLRNFTKLVYLDLEGNNIKYIPEDIQNSNINVWL
jgi:Leucine-rich repeat (LRR) protein